MQQQRQFQTPSPSTEGTAGSQPQKRKPAGGQQNQMMPTPPPPPAFPQAFNPLPAVNPRQFTTSQAAPQQPQDIGQIIQTLRALLGQTA